MSDPLVKRWLDAGELDLPLPGSGQPAKRWRKLAAFAEIDVVAPTSRSTRRCHRDPRRTPR